MATENVTQPRAAGDFMSPGIVLVHAGEGDHCAGYWDETGVGIHQAFDGPTFLVIGRKAEEEQLERAATRYRCTVAQLRAFRDGSLERLEVSHA